LFLTFVIQLTRCILKAISIFIGGIAINTFCERRKSFTPSVPVSCRRSRGGESMRTIPHQIRPCIGLLHYRDHYSRRHCTQYMHITHICICPVFMAALKYSINKPINIGDCRIPRTSDVKAGYFGFDMEFHDRILNIFPYEPKVTR
jgi:hypothetical protein